MTRSSGARFAIPLRWPTSSRRRDPIPPDEELQGGEAGRPA